MGPPENEHPQGRKPRSLTQRESDAVTDLVAYALNLDIEYDLLDKRVGELSHDERSALALWSAVRERAELAEEMEEFRSAIAAFREQLARQ